jgi:hypothetical protein
MILLPETFPHTAPKNQEYVIRPSSKENVIAIWLRNHRKFDYNLGKKTETIHSFYNQKTKEYHAPINSKKIGKKVNIQDTTCYTAMQIKPSPLDSFFI